MEYSPLDKEAKLAILREVAKSFPLSAAQRRLLKKDILFIEVNRHLYKTCLREAHMLRTVKPREDTYFIHRYVPNARGMDTELIGLIHPDKGELEIGDHSYDVIDGRTETYPMQPSVAL